MSQTRMNRSDILTSVRNITEMDTNDVSDATLSLYLRDGYNRIIDLERRWNFLEVSFTMTTVVNQTAYTINDFTNDDIREVVSIVDDNYSRLEFISYDEAEIMFRENNATGSSRPMFYSVWADQIHLFPKPNAVINLSVRAYRTPSDWVTNNSTVDGPDAFDIPLVYYVVSRVYQSQEELTTAGAYERSFNDAIVLARRDLTRPPSAAPVVFAGGHGKRLWKGSDWSPL